MLIGGFFDVDTKALAKKPEERNFDFLCDCGGHYHRKVLTNNGRTATVYALQHGCHVRPGNVVLLPEYLCVSVVNSIEAVHAAIRFYRVNSDLSIDCDDLAEKMDDDVKVIYVIHYFGFPQPRDEMEAVRKLAENYGVPVIEDLTQALFSAGTGQIGFGNYLVGSVRKWFSVTDGGIVAARDGSEWEKAALGDAYDEAVYKQMLISLLRRDYVQDPEKDKNFYLAWEREANRARYLDFTPREMTDVSQTIFFGADRGALKRKRRENYSYLYEHLQGLRKVKIFERPLDNGGHIIPFGFLITAENRDSLYRCLVEHNIIPEIQWALPTQYYQPSPQALWISEHSLMLQCDQRYGEAEMERTVQIVQEYDALKEN